MGTAPTRPTATPLTPEASRRGLARCVGDVEDFLERCWATRPHRRPHPDPAGFADLLSLAAVDQVLTTTAPRAPSFRLVKDGQPLPVGSYTRSGRVGGQAYQGAADPLRISQELAEGATIVLQSLHRSWAPLARFCRDLELALTHPAQANAYLTPAGAVALAPHHDTHDVFVLQVHGHKHWRVCEPVVEAPLPRHHSRQELAAAQPVLFESDLGPGDCLYLPRGFVHAAAAQQDASLHITIGIHAATTYDVLSILLERAGEHPAFRSSLPAGFARDGDGLGKGLRHAVEACLVELHQWLDSVDPEPVAAELADRFWSQRPPILDGQLQQVVELDHLDDRSLVARRAGSIAERRPGDPDRLRVLVGNRELTLPASVGPALWRLLDGEARPVSALADLLDAPSRLVLVRRLVREGLVEVVDGR